MKKYHLLWALLLALLPWGSLGEGAARTYWLVSGLAESLAAYNGSLYLLMEEGLYTLNPDTGEEIRQGEAPGFSRLLSGTGGLYGLDEEATTLYRLAPGEPQALAELPGSFIRSGFVAEDCAFFLTDQGIWRISLATGEAALLPTQGVEAIAPYQEGKLLAIQQKRVQWQLTRCLAAVDGETGEAQALCQLRMDGAAALRDLAWDTETQQACFASGSRLYTWQPGQEVGQAAAFLRGDVMGLALLPGNRAAVLVDGQIISLRSLEPGQESAQLVIQEPLGRGESYPTWVKAHPERELVFTQPEDRSNEERFIQDMLTGESAIDLYVLSDTNLLATLKSKGYWADLSQSPMLSQAAAEWYPPYQAAFAQGCALAALPKEIFLPMLSYRPEAFAALGLEPPETYAEFFDFCLQWLAGLGADCPGYYLPPLAELRLDAANLFKKYADELSRNGQPLSFQGPALEALTAQYLSLAALDFPLRETGEEALFMLMDLPAKGFCEYLPLVFHQGATPVIDVSANDLSYFVVNPYSPRQAEALAFLASYLQDIPPGQRAVLFASTQAVAGNEEAVAEARAALEGTRAALAEADPAEKRDLEALSRRQEEALAAAQAQWVLSPQEIATCQAWLGSVYFNPLNPITALVQTHPDFLDAWQGADPSQAPRLLKRLDDQVQKILTE